MIGSQDVLDLYEAYNARQELRWIEEEMDRRIELAERLENYGVRVDPYDFNADELECLLFDAENEWLEQQEEENKKNTAAWQCDGI